MRLLLDTHIFLWWINGSKEIKKSLRSKILNAPEVFISSASIWELAIKVNLKKMEANISELSEAIYESDFKELPITFSHVIALTNLPNIHRDPFDRMLIAQAISEPLIFLTADKTLKNYSELVEII